MSAKPKPKAKQTGLDPLEARRRVMKRWEKPGAREAQGASIRTANALKEAQARIAELEKELRAAKRRERKLALAA